MSEAPPDPQQPGPDPTTPGYLQATGPQGWAPPPGSPGAAPGYGAPTHGPPSGNGRPPLGWVSTPWGPRWRGPVGEATSVGITILLSIITCGIWTWVWSYKNQGDLQRYRGDGLSEGLGLVLAIFVPVVLMFTIPSEIEKLYQEEGLTAPVKTVDGLWFLLPIAGQIVWYVKVQQALNQFWVARGAVPA